MMLSTRTKESIKTALAMTIVYGIALAMDWDRPYWAGFAVAFISLSTVGQSLNQAIMRMLGTLVAVVVALTILALFPQDRWGFMLALSAVVGICTYWMGDSRRSYFWFVAGYVTVELCFYGGTIAANEFQTAILRAQETGLGILVYGLVTTLLWPNNSRREFILATAELATSQHALYSSCIQLMADTATRDQAYSAALRQTKAYSRFEQALRAARSDSYEVSALRQQWARYQRQSTRLMHTLGRWREDLLDASGIDLNSLLPTLPELSAELDQRFADIERLLAGKPAHAQPRTVAANYRRDRVRQLSHFDRAAFVVMSNRLQQLDKLSWEMLDCVSDIGGFETPPTPQRENPVTSPDRQRAKPMVMPMAKARLWVPDPDGITAAVRAMAGMWLAYLIWIYVEIPGGDAFVIMAGPLGMMLASIPRARVMTLLKPALLSCTFAGLLHILVMPQLSGFTALGTMIFLATFAICYLYAAPQRSIDRAVGLSMFLIITGISNQQRYSFLVVADTTIMLILLILLLAFVAWIPSSPQPEKVYLRLLGRFFHSSEYLMTRLYRKGGRDLGRLPSPLQRWRSTFHAREVASLPAKLAAWAVVVDTGFLPGSSAEQLQALGIRLDALSRRLWELVDVDTDPQVELLMQTLQAEAPVRELRADIRGWRLKIQETLRKLARTGNHPQGFPQADRLAKGQAQILTQLEARIRDTLNNDLRAKLTDRDGENFYRLLGAYRGVSEALVDYIASAERIDWVRWRENRF